MKTQNQKGVQCECGEFTPFTSWVFAHWDIVSEFACPKCDRRYTIFQGQAKLEDFENHSQQEISDTDVVTSISGTLKSSPKDSPADNLKSGGTHREI